MHTRIVQALRKHGQWEPSRPVNNVAEDHLMRGILPAITGRAQDEVRIERFCNKLKHFPHIPARCGLRTAYFLAAVQLASSMI
jgi:hypothetical protein